MLFIKGSYESKWQRNLWLSFDHMLIILQTLIITGAMGVLRTMRNQGVPFNKDTMILASGTCYKLVKFRIFSSQFLIWFNITAARLDFFFSFLFTVNYVEQNTVESYRICTALMEEEQTKGHFVPRHAYCFAVALALRRVSWVFFVDSLHACSNLWGECWNVISFLLPFLVTEWLGKGKDVVCTDYEHW